MNGKLYARDRALSAVAMIDRLGVNDLVELARRDPALRDLGCWFMVNDGGQGDAVLRLAVEALAEFVTTHGRFPAESEIATMPAEWHTDTGWPRWGQFDLWAAFGELQAYGTDCARAHPVDTELALDAIEDVLERLLAVLVRMFTPTD